MACQLRHGAEVKQVTVARVLAVGLGTIALSPASVFVLRAGQSLGGLAFGMLVGLDVLALTAVVWGLRSLSGAALLGTVAALPWAYYFGTEAGPWVSLVAIPEYLLLVGLGWFGHRRESRRVLRWMGALVPTLALVYAGVAPFVRNR